VVDVADFETRLLNDEFETLDAMEGYNRILLRTQHIDERHHLLEGD
jgi:hypothetical protein